MIEIRPATQDDAAAIATVHLRSWIAQFSQILSEDVIALKNLDEAAEIKKWQKRLNEEEGKIRWTFLAIQDGKAVAFITGGANRSDTADYDAELYQIYVLPEAQQQGLGKRLTTALAEKLLDEGFQSMLVWVMTLNAAIAFYRDSLNGKDLKLIRNIPEAGTALQEVAYGWSDLQDLIGTD